MMIDNNKEPGMAEFRCQGECKQVKDVETGFYKANSTRGHDGTCKVCRLIEARQRLRERRLNGVSPPKRRKGRDPANGYIKKGHQGAKFTPSPAEIKHGTWLIRARDFFDRFFSKPKDKSACLRCPEVCKYSLKDIVGADYY